MCLGQKIGGRDWNTEMVELQNATAIIKYREKFRPEKIGRLKEMVELWRWSTWEILLYIMTSIRVALIKPGHCSHDVMPK